MNPSTSSLLSRMWARARRWLWNTTVDVALGFFFISILIYFWTGTRMGTFTAVLVCWGGTWWLERCVSYLEATIKRMKSAEAGFGFGELWGPRVVLVSLVIAPVMVGAFALGILDLDLERDREDRVKVKRQPSLVFVYAFGDAGSAGRDSGASSEMHVATTSRGRGWHLVPGDQEDR